MSDFLTPEFLSRFTAKDKMRVGITTPWSKDGFTYATNGAVLIRIPGVVEFDSELRRVSAEALLAPFADAFDSQAGWFPLDRIHNPYENGKCLECLGTGRDFDECVDCEGSGEGECCECNQEIPCKACKGKGKIFGKSKCPYCDGAMEARRYGRYTVTPSGVFDGKLLALFSDLPDAAIYVPDTYIPLQIAVVRFTGGVGALMPIKTDDQREVFAMRAEILDAMSGVEP